MHSYRDVRRKRRKMLRFKRGVREAHSQTGIKYLPRSGFWPLSGIDDHPDIWFRAKFPDGDQLEIHLTYERGYEDIDGMAQLSLYERFASDVLPRCSLWPDMNGQILDCACGSGYGSNFLQRKLKCSVVGVDIDSEVVKFATKRYASNNQFLAYKQADATKLDFLDCGSVLGIISVETIEHVVDDAKVVAEFRRVLQPSGIMYMSTPDATDRPGTLTSEFHVREYSRDEYESLLRSSFESVEIIKQGEYLLATSRA